MLRYADMRIYAVGAFPRRSRISPPNGASCRNLAFEDDMIDVSTSPRDIEALSRTLADEGVTLVTTRVIHIFTLITIEEAFHYIGIDFIFTAAQRCTLSMPPMRARPPPLFTFTGKARLHARKRFSSQISFISRYFSFEFYFHFLSLIC